MQLKKLPEKLLRRCALAVAGVLSLAHMSYAQPASSYVFTASNGTYTPITGGTQLNSAIPDSWVSSAITLSPAFTFAGTSYTTAYVTSNGLLNLGGAAPSTTNYNAISSTTGSGISILPFNADLQASSLTGALPEIRFETVGNEHVFQWQDAMRYAYSDMISIQVRLNTVTGEVKFVYGGALTIGTNTSRQPIVGIRTATTDYKSITVGTGAETWAAPLPGTSTTDAMRFTSTAPAKSPVAGQTYTFAPPPPCVAPVAQPTALLLNSAASAVAGSFTAPATAPDYYLVVRTQGAPLNTPPVNGTTYTVGGNLGNGVIDAVVTSPAFVSTGLSSNTSYTYTIYSMNNICAGGPLYNTVNPLVGTVATSVALAYTWNATTGSADATLPASWTPARNVPDASDTLYFSNGGSSTATNLATSTVAKIGVKNNTTIITNAASAAVLTIAKELNIEAGSTLDLSGSVNTTLNFAASGAPQTSTIAGTLKMSATATTCNYTATNSITTVTGTIENSATGGALTSSAANLFFNAGSTYIHNRNAGSVPTATYNSASTINVTGIVAGSLTPPAKVGNLIWNCPAQTSIITWSSTVDSILGNFTVISTGTGRVEGGNGPDMQVMGDFTQTGGTYALGNYTSGTGLLDVFGTVNLNGGTFLMNSATASTTATYQFRANTNFNQAAAHTIDRLNTNAAGVNVITFAGTSSMPVNIAGTISNNISYTLNNPIGAVLTGVLPVNQNAINTVTSGAWSGTGSFTYNSTNSTLAYNGIGAQTAALFEFPAAGGPTSLTVNKTTGTVLAMPFSRTIPGTLTLTSGDIELGANTLTLGTSASAPGTMSGTGGLIRVSTGSLVRWYGTTGLPTAAGTGIGYYPMASMGGVNRAVSLYFNNATALSSGGTIAVTHNNATGLTTGLSVADGAYTINNRTNGSWSFATGNGIALGAGNTTAMRITAATMFNPVTVANLRIMQPAAVVGTHVAGAGTAPNYQLARTGLTLTDLAATPYHIGGSNADMLGLFTAINNGNWTTASTWDINAVPTINDATIINSGVNVTVSPSSVGKSVTVLSGGTLTVSANTLTIDDAIANNGTINISGTGTMTLGPAGGGNKTFTNSGTFNMTGGSLNVNGNINSVAGSFFTQSGGNISVDGNAAGVAANSVASGTAIVSFKSQNLVLSGGTLMIVDPHANSTASNTLEYNNSVAHVNASPAHTVVIGDGVSTDAGGNATNGFRITTFPGSNRLAFGNLTINAGTGTNRHVTNAYAFGISGNLTVNSGDFRTSVTTYVAGNITVNTGGTLTGNSTIYMGNYLSGTAAPATTAQTISGAGTFRNSPTTVTANLSSLQVNNTSAAGVTINIGGNLAYSGTLTFTKGVVNIGNNILIQIAGAGISGNSATTGWVVGKFQKNAGTGGISHTYPIGDANNYTPVVINGPAGAVTTAGDIIVSTTPGDHPNINSAQLDPTKSVNRYFTVATANGIAFTPGALTMTVAWDATDVDAAANTANFVSAKYAGSAWANQTVSTPLATSIIITNLGTGLDGQYQVAEFSLFPLAIKMKEITAANVDARNRIDWSTATEAKGDMFELQRSADGERFEYIASINAKGTSASYTYWDEQPIQGINYYRLKIIDPAGNYSYSAVVKALVKSSGLVVVDAYPNPVKDVLTVKAYGNTGNAHLTITDISGKLVRSITMYGDKTEIDISGLGQGMYLVKYADQNHTETIKINKQ